MDEENIQTFDDGKTKVSGELREDKVCWTAGDNPWIDTCRECFDERTREHGKCFDDECACWCMLGKQWPIWALFGLKPPEGSAYRLENDEESQAETAHATEHAPVRHRSPVLLAGFILASVAVVVLVTDNHRYDGPTGHEFGVATPDDEDGGTVNAPDLQRQTMGVFPPDAGVILANVLGGLKMPDKPKPHWLRPGKDGICRDSTKKEEDRNQVVIRGACWEVMSRLPGEKTCPSPTYDPPPEVLNDPKLKLLHRCCFLPWVLEGTAVDRDEPDSRP